MTIKFHEFDNFRRCLLIAVLLVGFLAAPVAHFIIDLILGQQSAMERVGSFVQVEWSDAPGLVILGLLNLIPYFCLCGILLAGFMGISGGSGHHDSLLLYGSGSLLLRRSCFFNHCYYLFPAAFFWFVSHLDGAANRQLVSDSILVKEKKQATCLILLIQL
ncbi:hypothetical protein [Endozoicomonas numazuensis]|uniref:Uncharacterized protein n=1 Tax=Endozoicomonas numazuensis TaxID=1137799 RepID=A0A081NED8_9GAMM|nr:hypothetical protein [Endozoicomonas numazuensis]KEQ16811.1 hypothetical protein GZ78_19250 [Endozoicomonas numazuensis]